jgi:predicted nucleic acid-binding protein
VRPQLAAALVVQISERMTVVPLTADDYIAAISACAAAGQPGAMIYDALLIACARKWSANRIVTWNLRHFRAIAPDFADWIVEPEGYRMEQP